VAVAATGGCAHRDVAANRVGIIDRSSRACAVSYDGDVWYRVPAGTFAPINVRMARCETQDLASIDAAPLPRWAVPDGPTQTRFVATSLQQYVSLPGMESHERSASAYGIPMTWMIGNLGYIPYAKTYDAFHAANGDDVQSAYFPSLHAAIAHNIPWYAPKVSVASAGTERLIPSGLYPGEHAFWGIAWNSLGTDGTWDYGAPWGTYCADVESYKRPQPDGGCDVLAFEWTARDLTRAYLSGREDAFSNDPDDLQRRGGFSVRSAVRYVRAFVDAYAAAGQSQPIVMMFQQETHDELFSGDKAIVDAMFARVVRDKMKVETLARAARDARTFSAQPRAVAFPYITGGKAMPSRVLDGKTLYPATIDYHDAHVGMTFVAGRTLPTRQFRYADYPVSRFNRPLPEVPEREMPALTGVGVSNGWLAFALQAPRAIRSGVAIWANPDRLRLSGSDFVKAGRAGVVFVFELHKGLNVVRYRCAGCTGTTFDYST